METTTYAIGDRVTYRGRKATIYQPERGDTRHLGTLHLLRMDENGEGWEGGYGQGARMLWVTEEDSDLKPATSTPEPTPLPTTEDLLRAQITAMEQDVRTIGEHLKETAQRHEWCGEYEEHLAKLLRSLSGFTEDTLKAAASRTRTYYVTYTLSTTIEAKSEEEAIELAERYDGRSGDWSAEEAD